MKNTTPDSTNRINDLINHNSENALKEIYQVYSKPISRYILMYVRSKEVTEELLSDVFYTLWEKRKELQPDINLNAYLYAIAKYKSLNYLRDNRFVTVDMEEVSIDLFAFTETTAEDEYISQELIEEINQAIESLPPKCKLAFKLVREDRMKYKDAAEHLGISIKTLEIHLTTAMKKLREKLASGNRK